MCIMEKKKSIQLGTVENASNEQDRRQKEILVVIETRKKARSV